jgi:Kef-type K+ transport system membrane component KefB/nucleotide-binding universal stress UspA family protein
MSVILITPLLSERLHLPGIVGIILGGMLIGPYGLRLIEAGDRMEFLSTIGLVYLMFNAGLEVDLNQFRKVGGRALIFGVLTFVLPQMMGMGLGWLLGLSWLGMILLGSAFSSHTLLAFPILMRLGLARNQAVAVTAGATVLTDIAAFIILAVVMGTKSGGLEPTYFVRLIGLLLAFGILIIFGLPRLGKMFFRRFSGRAVEFQFILVVLFVAALGAQLIGVHEVVGAFLAGLAIGATLPRHSPITGHVLFMGESFFIPIFLLYSGMITNPTVFLNGSGTLLVALGVVFVAYVSKFIAAWLAARLFRYSRVEMWITYGLSHAQAAVTIPTLVIGLQLGLFDQTLFNAAILMILFTSITSPLLVQRAAAHWQPEQAPDPKLHLFDRILVPIANPQNQQHLLLLARILAQPEKGKTIVLHVVREQNGEAAELEAQKELLERMDDILNDPEANLQFIPRVSSSYAQGILHTSIETGASLILLGWRGKPSGPQAILGTVLDEVIWGSDTPVLVSKIEYPLNGMRRVILLLPSGSIAPSVQRRFLAANAHIAQALNVPLLVLADASYLAAAQEFIAQAGAGHPASVEQIRGSGESEAQRAAGVNDLLVVPGFGSRKRFLYSVGNLPERLAASVNGNLLILHFDR